MLAKSETICYDVLYFHTLFIFDRKGDEALSQRAEAAAERLKQAYAAYYDIESVEDGTGLRAICSFHSRDSQYVLVKKAELWAAETHEYLYLWAVERLNGAMVDEIFRRVLEDGTPRVKPHSQHMATYLTAVVLCESAGEDALAKVKKLRKRQDFKLSLHGWMEFRIAAADLSAVEVTANRSGKVMVKDLKRLLRRSLPQQENQSKGEETNQ